MVFIARASVSQVSSSGSATTLVHWLVASSLGPGYPRRAAGMWQHRIVVVGVDRLNYSIGVATGRRNKDCRVGRSALREHGDPREQLDMPAHPLPERTVGQRDALHRGRP
jgi:hypothetical protein